MSTIQVKKKNGDELLTAKAFNGRVIMSWLNHTFLAALEQHADNEILLLTSSAMKLGYNIFVLCTVGGFGSYISIRKRVPQMNHK